MRKINWTYWITAVVVHMFLIGAVPVVETRKLDPQVAAERAEKARRTREANKLKKLTPAQKAARTRALNADRPVSPAWAIEGREPTKAELASISN